MSAYAVVFPHGTPQQIADRTAATLRAIVPLIDGPQDG